MRFRSNMWKAVILIGGPEKGTRFRPLSLDVPKPLFPVAGFPMIQHHIEACSKIPEIKEVILIGFFSQSEELRSFMDMAKSKYSLNVNYLPEYEPLGTAGGLYHFRDQILAGNPQALFVFNSDVCCNFPLEDIRDFHREKTPEDGITIVATEATHRESMSYGCVVEDPCTGEATHYVEKPETFVSSLINCGVYVFSPGVLKTFMSEIVRRQRESVDNEWGDWVRPGSIRLETQVLTPYAGSGKMFVYKTKEVWGQIKSAASAIYANKLYLSIYRRSASHRLAERSENGPSIQGDVFIHETASVDPSAVLGPNVTVGENVRIGAGVRVANSILLPGATLQDHCCILNAIIGWRSTVGKWSRVEGTPHQLDPNAPYAKVISGGLFDDEGKLIPSITVLGREVSVASEIIILNSIVLPSKNIHNDSKNQIIL